jgi:multisubunit Na+/H+ antiporter MnhB subunit
MNNLMTWFVEGIDGALVILVGASFILLVLSSFFGPAKVRWWFTCGDRWRW